MPVDFGHSAILFLATWVPNVFFLFALQTPEFLTHFFIHIHTKYVLDQGLEANQFSVPCRFHLWPLRGQLHLFLVCTINPRVFNWSSNSNHSFLRCKPRCQSIFSTLQCNFWPWGGQLHISCMCPTPLSFQGIFSKLAPNINWTMVPSNLHQVFMRPWSRLQSILATH